MEIVLPGQVDEESNQEINICIICQYSENVNIYLCNKNINKNNCRGSFLHEKCLKDWIKNNNTFQLKCLNCNSNEIIIPENIKNNLQIVENDALTNLAYIILNQYTIENNNSNRNYGSDLMLILVSLILAILIILLIHNNGYFQN